MYLSHLSLSSSLLSTKWGATRPGYELLNQTGICTQAYRPFIQVSFPYAHHTDWLTVSTLVRRSRSRSSGGSRGRKVGTFSTGYGHLGSPVAYPSSCGSVVVAIASQQYWSLHRLLHFIVINHSLVNRLIIYQWFPPTNHHQRRSRPFPVWI